MKGLVIKTRRCFMGLSNSIQNSDWNDALQIGVRKILSPTSRTRTEGLLGGQKIEHGVRQSRKETLPAAE